MSRLPLTSLRMARSVFGRQMAAARLASGPPSASGFSAAAIATVAQPNRPRGASRRKPQPSRLPSEQLELPAVATSPAAVALLRRCARAGTPAAAAAALDLLERVTQHEEAHADAATAPQPRQILRREDVAAVVRGWREAHEQNPAETFSPAELVRRLDAVARAAPSLAAPAGALAAVINAAVEAGDQALAERLLRRLLEDDATVPSTPTIHRVLQGYCDARRPDRIEALLRRCRSRPVRLDTHAYNLWLTSLAESDRPEQAQRRLEELCRGTYRVPPDLRSVHAVLRGWARRGDPRRAEALMARLGDPADLGALGLRPDTRALNLVLAGWARSGEPGAGHRACNLLREQQAWAEAGMPHMAPDVVSYGTVIHALCSGGDVEQAEALLQGMYQQYMSRSGEGETGALLPNVKLLTPILQGWANSQASDRLQRAQSFFMFLKDWAKYFLQTSLDRAAYHVMMSVYDKCAASDEDLHHAIDLLEEMKHLPPALPSFRTYAIVIQLLLRHSKIEQAEALLEECQRRYSKGHEICRPDATNMNQIIYGFSRATAPDHAARILFQMCEALRDGKQDSMAPVVSSFGSVIAAYSRSSLPHAAERAEEVYRQHIYLLTHGLIKDGPDYLMQRARLACWSKSTTKDASLRAYGVLQDMMKIHTPDVNDYNLVLNALARQWKPRRAEQLLDDLIKQGKINPNRFSFNAVLLAWSRVDSVEVVERVEQLLVTMEQLSGEKGWNVAPDAVSYNNLLHCLARNSQMADAGERAEAVLRKMIESNKDSYLSFGTVISLWLKTGQIERAESVLRTLYEECRKGRYTAQKGTFEMVSGALHASGNIERAENIMTLWRNLKYNRK